MHENIGKGESEKDQIQWVGYIQTNSRQPAGINKLSD